MYSPTEKLHHHWGVMDALDELDAIEEEALASEEAREEALWSLHHAAAMSASHLNNGESDGALLSSSESGSLQRPRFSGEYTCDVCGETFFSIVQLAKHRQFHDRDRPYECSICGKRFLSRSHHHEHQRVHTGERPFPCERCDRSFTTHHNLKRHMTIHEKEEMYRCQECGVLFCQEHEYNMEKLRLPSTLPSIAPHAPPSPPTMTTPMPVMLESHEFEHTIDEDEAPSSSNVMTRIEQILTEKKKKRKMRKKQSLIDVSRNIAARPLYSPPEKKHKSDTYYDQPALYRRKDDRKLHARQRVAYDIEVVL
ncbi:zinc finger protein 135-like isoform X1 [Alosa alosa]|uniref:zinc finger protein 135-like isoform X1 n=2 Tax=Alosa alosa TaxID=278164 RepID=UPI00201516B3|nr:zinc finger protein 135-like isoform X1 [Alosa alosa]